MNINDYCTIIEKFEEVVNKMPNKVAVVSGEKRIDFISLYNRVNAYANGLLKYSDKDQIGVFMESSIERIACILAIMKIGAVYVPLDKKMPVKRINDIIEDAKIQLIVVDDSKVDNIAGIMCVSNQRLLCNDINDIEGKRMNRTAESLAYIIYTSGSSGKPKGVMISNKALVNFMVGLKDKICFRDDEIVLSHTTCVFDISIFEMLISLCYGFTIVIVGDDGVRNVRKLKRIIIDERITVLQITPSLLVNLMYDNRLDFLNNLNILMVGGEKFPESILSELLRFPNLKIYNMYGPTEATIWASVYQINSMNKISIGTPLPNYKFDIIDSDEFGQGELCISGISVANGYFNRIDETKKYFKYTDENTKRTYATGDIVKKDYDGDIVFVGRKDAQIKLRGYRIELEEIENKLKELLGIDQVLVVNIENGEVSYLVALIKSDNLSLIDEIKISEHLPAYMIPNKYLFVKDMLYTINGKIDRKRLSIIVKNRELFNCSISIEFKNVQENIMSILEKHTMQVVREEDLNKNLDELMINSLSLVKILVDIERLYEIEFEDDFLNIDKINNFSIVIKYLLEKMEKNESNIWI